VRGYRWWAGALTALLAIVGAPSLAALEKVGAAPAKTPVEVFYAASLEDIMDNQLGPAFERATGDAFVGFPGGSKALAAEIRGGLERADVFISASPTVDASLMDKRNGNWVTHYKVFGRTYLEVGYNPHSRFAGQLRSRPWYQVVAEPGFRLGRTDPATDPKGALAQRALLLAANQHHLPALLRDATTSSNVFPEESLVGRVQAGDLDAGFFYQVEALAAKLPAVPLAGYNFYASYTVAQLNRAPHQAAAAAFVAFLTGPEAKALLAKDGMEPSGTH
jgi:molybdate/tungstate transport system substrate-binding protein